LGLVKIGQKVIRKRRVANSSVPIGCLNNELLAQRVAFESNALIWPKQHVAAIRKDPYGLRGKDTMRAAKNVNNCLGSFHPNSTNGLHHQNRFLSYYHIHVLVVVDIDEK
jgi:hypothetical protein